MSKISKRQETIFRDEYKKWLHELCDTLLDYREAMVETMKATDLKYFSEDEDFKEMAKHALFHKIQVFYEQEAAIEEANNLAQIDEDDYEDT